MKIAATILLGLTLGLTLVCSASGQVLRDKSTKVTLTEPMQVPGKILAPGTYLFKLNGNDSYRHIVQIFNEDQTKVFATIMAIPNERLVPTDKTIMTYEERPAGQPVALEAWFYPGDTVGQQFAYPQAKAEELSRLNRVDVPSTGSEEAYPSGTAETPAATHGSSTSSQTPEPTYSASARPDATTLQAGQDPATVANPTPLPARQAATPNASQDAAARLPNTASVLPLVGLLGATLIGVALLLKWTV